MEGRLSLDKNYETIVVIELLEDMSILKISYFID